jgi:2-keto-4-pentenoate hydratase/2-oxohepta-3-ene-1,7-dioic acid hydratase in catechol pathway
MKIIQLPIKKSSDRYPVEPSKIIALGLNYKEHIAESHSVKVKGFDPEIPAEPILFPKTPNCLVGPGENIVIPAFLEQYNFDDFRVDYEAELAFVIGEQCKDVSLENAMDVIFGYCCLNDVSQRNIQTGDKSGWFRGKSFDTFGPIGPELVLAGDIGDPMNLAIECRLNGKTVQQSNTKHMIFPIPEIVEFVSKNFTLYPGDIISTGTPSGVGRIQHGDTVEVEIENIGILRNPVVEESKA